MRLDIVMPAHNEEDRIDRTLRAYRAACPDDGVRFLEGQAYAMLLSVAADDRSRFDRVWGWTRAHLQRADGLLSWRWADGHVVQDEPAADADLDAARALVLAADRFGEPSYRDASRSLTRAIVRDETTFAADRPVLVAGRWARSEAVVNPSYWSPRAYQELGFPKVAESSRKLTDRLTSSGLPPDWAGAAVRGRAVGSAARR